MTKTKFEVMELCNAVDIPVGPILSMKELAEEPSLRETGTIVEVDHPKRGKNIVGVYVAPEKPGQKADPLKEAAVAAKLPVYQPASYRKPEVWEEFRALKPDLQVMAFVTLFVPEDFLNMPTRGSIQYHPSLLPKYRGPSAINWPIIKGEKETGLSIFWPDNGLDTGDVLVQKKTPISGTDTLGTVYFDRLFPMGVEAMLEGVDLVKAGKAPRIKQDDSKATYEGR